jgi:hypothetical protein
MSETEAACFTTCAILSYYPSTKILLAMSFLETAYQKLCE